MLDQAMSKDAQALEIAHLKVELEKRQKRIGELENDNQLLQATVSSLNDRIKTLEAASGSNKHQRGLTKAESKKAERDRANKIGAASAALEDWNHVSKKKCVESPKIQEQAKESESDTLTTLIKIMEQDIPMTSADKTKKEAVAVSDKPQAHEEVKKDPAAHNADYVIELFAQNMASKEADFFSLAYEKKKDQVNGAVKRQPCKKCHQMVEEGKSHACKMGGWL